MDDNPAFEEERQSYRSGGYDKGRRFHLKLNVLKLCLMIKYSNLAHLLAIFQFQERTWLLHQWSAIVRTS